MLTLPALYNACELRAGAAERTDQPISEALSDSPRVFMRASSQSWSEGGCCQLQKFPISPRTVTMTSTKRALVIGSSYDDLPGTENDVKTMVSILGRYGFQAKNVQTLCGAEATRKGILDAWEQMILESSKNDSVVIYYSGHGGLAELKELRSEADGREPTRIQFLVPTDYDSSLETWRGILDSEISKLLLDTTKACRNVTYILDCCHSARLGRAPKGYRAVPKALSTSDYARTLGHLKRLRGEKKLLENDCWSNPDVVRIAASADRETAWQYQNAEGQHVGILTEKLNLVIGDQGVRSSWLNIMAGVSALVEKEFAHDQKPQQSRSAGPNTRIPFSMDLDSRRALVAEITKKHVIIRGGLVHGVSVGDTFTLTPLLPDWETDAKITSSGDVQVVATVKQVKGFLALASRVSKQNFPYAWAMARPEYRQRRWPVFIPEGSGYGRTLLSDAADFEECKPGEKPLIEFRADKSQDHENSRCTLEEYGLPQESLTLYPPRKICSTLPACLPKPRTC